MRKAILAFLLFGFLGVIPAFAQGQDYSKVEMKVQKVAGTVYMLEGAGGNIGASVGSMLATVARYQPSWPIDLACTA